MEHIEGDSDDGLWSVDRISGHYADEFESQGIGFDSLRRLFLCH